MMINAPFIRYFKETDAETEIEKVATNETLKLLQGEIRGGGNAVAFLKETHNDFYAKMGWEHKADCACKSWVLE